MVNCVLPLRPSVTNNPNTLPIAHNGETNARTSNQSSPLVFPFHFPSSKRNTARVLNQWLFDIQIRAVTGICFSLPSDGTMRPVGDPTWLKPGDSQKHALTKTSPIQPNTNQPAGITNPPSLGESRQAAYAQKNAIRTKRLVIRCGMIWNTV